MSKKRNVQRRPEPSLPTKIRNLFSQKINSHSPAVLDGALSILLMEFVLSAWHYQSAATHIYT